MSRIQENLRKAANAKSRRMGGIRNRDKHWTERLTKKVEPKYLEGPFAKYLNRLHEVKT